MAIPEKIESARAQPHDLEAEAALLGSILLDNSSLSLVADKISKDNFYSTAHQLLYEVILEMDEANTAIDPTTLVSELNKRKLLEKVGGFSYVAALEDKVFAPQNIEHYASIVHDKARLRQLIASAYEILEAAYTEETDVKTLVDRSEKMIFDISQETVHGDFVAISDLTLQTLEEIQRRYHDKHDVTGLRTDYYKLDELTSGFQPSDLIILAARPSKGKTAFGLNVALRVATMTDKPVGIFSLEMSCEQLNNRLLCTLSKVPAQRVRTGYLSSEELRKLSEQGRRLARAPIYIDDTPGMTALELRAKARRLKSRVDDLSLVIVDYLQLMHSGGRIESRQQEVAEISRSMKALARELNVPVIAISQLSRMIEHRSGKDKRPMLSDLRESGAIEQDADVVMFIHPVEQDDEEEDEDREESRARHPQAKITEVIIGKQRNGPLGTVELLFFPEFMMFENPPKGVV